MHMICPRCENGELHWITDMEADDLFTKGIMQCRHCGKKYVGFRGIHMATKAYKEQLKQRRDKRVVRKLNRQWKKWSRKDKNI